MESFLKFKDKGFEEESFNNLSTIVKNYSLKK